MGITRQESIRREQASEAVRDDVARDLDEIGSDADYAARMLIDGNVDERSALKTKVRFNCLRLATMQERGESSQTAVALIDSLPEIERQATIAAFNAGIRG